MATSTAAPASTPTSGKILLPQAAAVLEGQISDFSTPVPRSLPLAVTAASTLLTLCRSDQELLEVVELFDDRIWRTPQLFKSFCTASHDSQLPGSVVNPLTGFVAPGQCPVPSVLVARAAARLADQDVIALLQHIPAMTPVQYERLISSKKPQVASLIAATPHTRLMPEKFLCNYVYSSSLRVRFELASNADTPTSKRIETLRGRDQQGNMLPPKPARKVTSEISVFIRGLTPDQLFELSDSTFINVLRLVGLYTTTVSQLIKLFTVFADLLEEVQQAAAQPPDGKTAKVFKRWYLLTDSITYLHTSLIDTTSAIVPHLVPAARTLESGLLHAAGSTCVSRQDIAETILPANIRSFVELLKTAVQQADPAVTPSEFLASATRKEVLIWLNNKPTIPDDVLDVLTVKALTELPSFTIQELFVSLQTHQVIPFLKALRPTGLQPWRDDIPQLAPLSELVDTVSVAQMFSFPPDQVEAFLTEAGLSVIRALELTPKLHAATPFELKVLAS